MPNQTRKSQLFNEKITDSSPHLSRSRFILFGALGVAVIQVNFFEIPELARNLVFLNILLLVSVVYYLVQTTLLAKYLTSLSSFIISVTISNTLLTLLIIYSNGMLSYLIVIYFIAYLVLLSPREIIALTLLQIGYFNLVNYVNTGTSIGLKEGLEINSIILFLGISAANLVREFSERNNRLVELKELNHLKNTFIAIISHNLRTPITAITGYLSLIDKEIPKVKKQTKNDLKNALYNTENLSELVDDIIELTKIESGRAIFDVEKVDVVALTKKLIEIHFEKLAAMKEIDLRFEATDVHIKEALIDAKRTAIAISNVIDNAIKFTDTGVVRVHINQEGEFVVIKVIDTGPGITNLNLLRIFNQFHTFGEFFDRESSGLGLGLYTTKLIIENQHGLVEINSEADHGTTFTIKLPTEVRYVYG